MEKVVAIPENILSVPGESLFLSVTRWIKLRKIYVFFW